MVETSDEWITSRTGIKQRHIAVDGQMNSDICFEAAKAAINNADIAAEDVDCIVLGTVSGDVDFPATACYVQEKLGAVSAVAFDISAACSGFLYGLSIANSFITSGQFKNVLVIGAETLSRIVNWEDRNTCVLFGDGAGAAVIQPVDNGKGILSVYMKSDGRLTHLLLGPGHRGGKDFHDSEGNVLGPHIHMQGREVFKHAVRSMEEACILALEKGGKKLEDVNLVIPHQANIRIIDMLASRLKVKEENLYVNVDRFGNTSAASIPIALNEARNNGRLKEGDLCLMTVFGSGFTWGAALVQF